MRGAKLFLICLCCLIVVPAVWGQETKSSAKPGILGYLDPQTGAFRPVPAVVDENAEAPAATVFGGTITVTVTITVKSVGITSVSCTADTTVFDSTAGGSWSEIDTAPATGTTTRTCKLTIPYSWSLLSGATDTMTTFYTVTGFGGSNTRTSSHSPLDTRKVPANGTITALTANVTI